MSSYDLLCVPIFCYVLLCYLYASLHMVLCDCCVCLKFLLCCPMCLLCVLRYFVCFPVCLLCFLMLFLMLSYKLVLLPVNYDAS